MGKCMDGPAGIPELQRGEDVKEPRPPLFHRELRGRRRRGLAPAHDRLAMTRPALEPQAGGRACTTAPGQRSRCVLPYRQRSGHTVTWA
jgi:hypothetical protein